MSCVLIFAGTSEGRTLAELMNRYGKSIHICVATEYGEKVLEDELADRVTVGRLDVLQMEELMEREGADQVVDATHPYAVVVSENIRHACEDKKIPYLRLLRKSEEDAIRDNKNVVVVGSVEEATEYLKGVSGKALLTTGSKELEKYTVVEHYAERFVARVLPSAEVLEACQKLGFEGKNVIAMQGPFSEEMNTAMLRQTGASFLVTKESGKAGGFPAKVRAAERAGAKLVLVRRPSEEQGLSLEETVARLCPEGLNEVREIQLIPTDPRKITLLGIGMGAEGQLTLDGARACREADVIIGAKRMLEALRGFEKPVYESYRSGEILKYIHEHPEYHRVVVALSGDVGFYSGAKKLLAGMEEDKVELLCGISSVEYFCSRLHTPWEDVTLVSAHGRRMNLAAAIRENPKVFALVGSSAGMRDICRELIDVGLGHVKLWVGQNLSYPEEKILEGSPEELLSADFAALCVVLAVNPQAADHVVTHGIPDEEFLREKVPMTKEEIRSISLSKLRLTRRSVLWDVGAGTGSVSVEAARQATEGMVYAVEKKTAAAELTRRNARKFGVTNLAVIEGTAPEALEDLPVPTHVFVGGSAGNLEGILEAACMKNPEVRIVVNTVTLETMAALTEYLRKHPPVHRDLVQVSCARAKEMGNSHLMTGMNPVLIASFDYRGEEL